MFETWRRPYRRFTSVVGSRIKAIYSPEFDKKGVMTLKVSGQENLYEFIQSHKDSVDIHKILERFERGDVSALQKAQGMYGDFSEFPKTYAELLNIVIEGEQTFNSLPLEVREKFGHSFHRWLATMGSAEWLSAMGLEVPAPPVENPVESVPPAPEPSPTPAPEGVNKTEGT